jgi:hypothetical protein
MRTAHVPAGDGGQADAHADEPSALLAPREPGA